MTQISEAWRIAIIGGGISGITSALLLQLSGEQTILYARERPSGHPSQAWDAPEFATLHAAASVLPHSVRSSRMADWTRASQSFFRALAFRAEAGVRTQTHYEMFESATVAEPAYVQAVGNFEMLDQEEVFHPGVPRRTDAKAVSGWSFSAYFCEAPTYLRYLYRFYQAVGGRVVAVVPGSPDCSILGYLQRGHQLVVNCTGLGSTALLDADHLGAIEDLPADGSFEPLVDPWPSRVVRGHYIRAALGEPLIDDRSRFISYNYTPTPDIYPAHDQRAADVYCYPRSDTWVLGGSRQTQSGERWLGEDAGYETVSFRRTDGQVIAIPRPVLVLNGELIERISDGAIQLDRLLQDNPSRFWAGVGYRFERSHPEESVRVACSRVQLQGAVSFIVHNYGHGGAGYTLSWGCALDVVRIIKGLREGGWQFASSARTDPPEEFRTPTLMLIELAEGFRHEVEAGIRG